MRALTFGRRPSQPMTKPAIKRPIATAQLQLENERVIVTEWRFSAGAETTWHRHALDYVVIPQTTGTLTIESKDGTSPAELVSGQSYTRKAGVEHNVVNLNDHEFVFVEVELK